METDRELVERITREVLSRYYPRQQAKVLAIIMGGDRNLDKALASIKKIAQRLPTKILLTKSAQSKFGIDKIRLETGVQDIITGDQQDPLELVSWTDILVIPVLTLHGLVKISNLIPDTLQSNIVIGCLTKGKPIVVANDTIWLQDLPLPLPGTSIAQKVDDYFSQIRSYGIKITQTNNIAEAVFELLDMTPTYSVTQSTPTVGSSGISRDTCSAFKEGTECASCGKCIERKSDSTDAIIKAGADRISAYDIKDVRKELASLIDHTLLKPTATQEEIYKLCEEAKKFGFASVVVNPAYVPLAKDLLRGTNVKVTTVVGFPLGSTTTITKVIEAKEAIANGADEIDMVLNIGALKSGNYQLVYDDIKAVRDATRGKILKVILETAYLTDEEKVKACQLAKQAGADFVKTSTGFGPSGATVKDVQLMKEAVGPTVGVKASGGIRTFEQAQELVKAGATRIGASASVAIITGAPTTVSY